MSSRIQTVSLGSGDGLSVELVDFGAALKRVSVPTPAGQIDVVLGYADAEAYLQDSYCMGSTVGRFANRLRQDSVGVTADGASSTGVLLHGGTQGFHRRHWQWDGTTDGNTATFRLTIQDREDGFPGRLEATVRYAIVDGDTLDIELRATADASTPVNLTNHAYFNLSSADDSINRHELTVFADRFTEVDAELLPTGDISDVDGHACDFRRRRRLSATDAVIDQNMVVRGPAGTLRPAAELYSPDTGISLSVSTTQPGLQVYTGDNLAAPFAPRAGLCLEAQNFPDAPNHPHFPDAYFGPERAYSERIRYRFTVA